MAAPRKAPQDHKQANAEIVADQQQRFDEVEGHDLLKPFGQVDGFEQIRLIGRMKALGVTKGGEIEIDMDTMDYDALADLGYYVADNFALDHDEFMGFLRGYGGMERALSLVMSYVGELGNGVA